MIRFRIKNKNIFPLPGNNHLLHLGTIEYGLREFIILLYPSKAKCYIEEVVLNNIDYSTDVYASCKFIQDDSLASDLAIFAEEQKLTDMPSRINEIIDSGHGHWLF